MDTKLRSKVFRTPSDYVGEYLYFEQSENLYRVRNYRLDSNMYVGNGTWKENATRVTFVGAKNNRITKEKAEEIMRLKDNIISASSADTKVKENITEEVHTKSEEGKFLSKCFMYRGKLLKAISYQNSKGFKDRYHCSKYVGKGNWQHIGFFSGGTIENKVLDDKTTKRIMEELDSGKYKVEVKPASLEVKAIKKIEPVANIEKDEVLVVVNGKVIHEKDVTLPECPENIEVNLEAETESPVNLEANSHINYNVPNSVSQLEKNERITYTSNGNKRKYEDDMKAVEGIESNNLELKVGAYFVNKGYLFKITSIYPSIKIAYADYLSPLHKRLVPWNEAISLNEVIPNLIPEEDAVKRLSKPKEKDIEPSDLEEKQDINEQTSSPRINFIEADKVMKINVPTIIKQGMNVSVWIDKALKNCVIDDIIEPEVYNVVVEGNRVGALTKLFDTFRNLPVSNQKMTELIQYRLGETYVKLKFSEGNKDKYVYLSKSDLERSIELVSLPRTFVRCSEI